MQPNPAPIPLDLFTYSSCAKGQEHLGQSLSLVCLEPGCISNALLCNMCLHEGHEGHRFKSLKGLVFQAEKYLKSVKSLEIDSRQLKQTIAESQTRLLAHLEEFETEISNSLKLVRVSIETVFVKMLGQIDMRTGGCNSLLEVLEQIRKNQLDLARCNEIVCKFLAVDMMEAAELLTEKEISSSAIRALNRLEKGLREKGDDIKKKFSSMHNHLQKQLENVALFEPQLHFKFSTELKPAGLQVVNDNLIKCNCDYVYNVALLEPSPESKHEKRTRVLFRVKETINNWLGVGMAYESIMKASDYIFNVGLTENHGLYLITTNGTQYLNDGVQNSTNTFTYGKGDIVSVDFDPSESTITFCKKGSSNEFKYSYKKKENDKLRFCVLFYYVNDEIQYLGNDD